MMGVGVASNQNWLELESKPFFSEIFSTLVGCPYIAPFLNKKRKKEKEKKINKPILLSWTQLVIDICHKKSKVNQSSEMKTYKVLLR